MGGNKWFVGCHEFGDGRGCEYSGNSSGTSDIFRTLAIFKAKVLKLFALEPVHGTRKQVSVICRKSIRSEYVT